MLDKQEYLISSLLWTQLIYNFLNIFRFKAALISKAEHDTEHLPHFEAEIIHENIISHN